MAELLDRSHQTVSQASELHYHDYMERVLKWVYVELKNINIELSVNVKH